MNGKTVKKIRKEIIEKVNAKEEELCNQIFDHFNSLSFFGRVKIAVKIIRKKL